MQLPGDRRKKFVISFDTAYVHSADPFQRVTTSSLWPDAAAAKAAVAPRRSHAHAGPDRRYDRRTSRSIAGTVPTARGEARTQAIAARLLAAGYHGFLVRSFARSATDDELDLVLWRWAMQRPADPP
jgi:hypothetical protein